MPLNFPFNNHENDPHGWHLVGWPKRVSIQPVLCVCFFWHILSPFLIYFVNAFGTNPFKNRGLATTNFHGFFRFPFFFLNWPQLVNVEEIHLVWLDFGIRLMRFLWLTIWKCIWQMRCGCSIISPSTLFVVFRWGCCKFRYWIYWKWPFKAACIIICMNFVLMCGKSGES